MTHSEILAADNVEGGINLSTEHGQEAMKPSKRYRPPRSRRYPRCSQVAVRAPVMHGCQLRRGVLKLRRHQNSVLLVHHAGTNSQQEAHEEEEDALDTVIALRRPEDYSTEQGARFEINFEKLRNRVEGAGAMPFEARLETLDADGRTSIRWTCCRSETANVDACRRVVWGRLSGFGKWRQRCALAKVKQEG